MSIRLSTPSAITPDWVRKIYGETIPVDGPFLNYTLREPMGVVGAIVPWNYPLQIAAWKVAPALACGCSVVLKPSEWTPLTALKLAESAEAGLPEGVLNVVTGYGQTAGEALAVHMDVDKISFTGSMRTARRLLQASGESTSSASAWSWAASRRISSSRIAIWKPP